VESVAQENNFTKVTAIHLLIGDFAGVEEELMQRAFQLTKHGPLLDNADLVIQRIPLILYCIDCDNEYVAETQDLSCTSCSGLNYELVTGRELEIRSIKGA
jgi:hydrogenase nickel incorporation protein HypA/HybF